MAQLEGIVSQNHQADEVKKLTKRHKKCDGELKCLTKEPVMAGKPGNSYIVYQCSKCGEIVLFG